MTDATSQACGQVLAYGTDEHEHVCCLPPEHPDEPHTCEMDGCTCTWTAHPFAHTHLTGE